MDVGSTKRGGLLEYSTASMKGVSLTPLYVPGLEDVPLFYLKWRVPGLGQCLTHLTIILICLQPDSFC